MTEQHEQILASLRGTHYNGAREKLGKLDWMSLYPVVDSDGILTGEFVDANVGGEWDVCDVTHEGVLVHEFGVDAAVLRNT